MSCVYLVLLPTCHMSPLCVSCATNVLYCDFAYHYLCVSTQMLTLHVAVGKVSKLETPELKSDLEKAAKTAEDKAEVSTLFCHPFCFLHFHVNAALPVCGSHVPEQLMQIKHILR